MYLFRDSAEALEAAEHAISTLPRRGTSLDLSNYGLTTLPPRIGDLTRLQKLDVGKNRLTILPSVIGRLSSLRTLDVSENQIRVLPPEIKELINLRSLKLKQNRLKRFPIELLDLPYLRELEITTSQLHKFTAEELLKRLENLDANKLNKALVAQLWLLVPYGPAFARALDRFKELVAKRPSSLNERGALTGQMVQSLEELAFALRVDEQAGFPARPELLKAAITAVYPLILPSIKTRDSDLVAKIRELNARLFVHDVSIDEVTSLVDRIRVTAEKRSAFDLKSESIATDKAEQLIFRAPSGSEPDLKEHNKQDSTKGHPSAWPTPPDRKWVPRAAGRPRAGEGSEKLITFIREVYGPYFPEHRKRLRAYIFSWDPPLWRAINRYETNVQKLPKDIRMPSEHEISNARFAKAGLELSAKKPPRGAAQKPSKKRRPKISAGERAALRKKIWRLDKLGRL